MAVKIEAGKFYRTRDGRKVGPVEIDRTWGGKHPFHCNVDIDSPSRVGRAVWEVDGTNYEYPWLDLVAEWADEPVSPVRERLIKEIIDGVYGRVRVLSLDGTSDKQVGVRLTSPTDSAHLAALSASELRAAAATFAQLADALDEGSA